MCIYDDESSRVEFVRCDTCAPDGRRGSPRYERCGCGGLDYARGVEGGISPYPVRRWSAEPSASPRRPATARVFLEFIYCFSLASRATCSRVGACFTFRNFNDVLVSALD